MTQEQAFTRLADELREHFGEIRHTDGPPEFTARSLPRTLATIRVRVMCMRQTGEDCAKASSISGEKRAERDGTILPWLEGSHPRAAYGSLIVDDCLDENAFPTGVRPWSQRSEDGSVDVRHVVLWPMQKCLIEKVANKGLTPDGAEKLYFVPRLYLDGKIRLGGHYELQDVRVGLVVRGGR